MSCDPPADNRAFSEKFDFNFPLLCDVDRSMSVAYGACDDAAAKTARRIGVVVGPDGRIQRYDASVNARSYPQDILVSLKA